MRDRTICRAAFVAALVAFVSALVMGFGVRAPEPGVSLQPSTPGGPAGVFLHPINAYPRRVLGFFAADSLFVLSYLIVFVGLHASVVGRSRGLGAFGLGAGLLAGLLDATENAFFITYARLALGGVPLTEPALPLVYVVANLKYMAAFAAFYAFGLAWPRESRFDWVLSVFMVAFPLVGVLGIAWPALVPLRGLFLLLGMLVFAVHFWRRMRGLRAGRGSPVSAEP